MRLIPVLLALTIGRVLADREVLRGEAYLFPAPRAIGQPVSRDALALHQRRAERLDLDVAAAGGWRSVAVMKRAYQQADDASVLEAITSPRRLRALSTGTA